MLADCHLKTKNIFAGCKKTALPVYFAYKEVEAASKQMTKNIFTGGCKKTVFPVYVVYKEVGKDITRITSERRGYKKIPFLYTIRVDKEVIETEVIQGNRKQRQKAGRGIIAAEDTPISDSAGDYGICPYQQLKS